MRYWQCCLWASGALLPLAGAQAEDYPSLEIIPAFVELHTSPDQRFPVRDIAEHGEHVQVLKRRTRWYKLRTASGAQGWASDTELGSSLTAAGFEAPDTASSDPHS